MSPAYSIDTPDTHNLRLRPMLSVGTTSRREANIAFKTDSSREDERGILSAAEALECRPIPIAQSALLHTYGTFSGTKTSGCGDWS